MMIYDEPGMTGEGLTTLGQQLGNLFRQVNTNSFYPFIGSEMSSILTKDPFETKPVLCLVTGCPVVGCESQAAQELGGSWPDQR